MWPGCSYLYLLSRALASRISWLASSISGLFSGGGSQLQAVTSGGIIDDDLVGNVTVSSAPFCLDLSILGGLEVWAGPLSGGRFVVVLYNRSPAADTITAYWHDIGVSPNVTMKVRDIWAAQDVGVFVESYTAGVPAHGVAFLVLSPS